MPEAATAPTPIPSRPRRVARPGPAGGGPNGCMGLLLSAAREAALVVAPAVTGARGRQRPGREAELAGDAGLEPPVAAAQGRERVEGGTGGALEGPDAPVEAVADEVHGPPVEHELAAHERATLVPAATEHDALA